MANLERKQFGISSDKASPGDHKHNGSDSRKLMSGVTISGSRGGNVALAHLLTELAKALGFTDATTP